MRGDGSMVWEKRGEGAGHSVSHRYRRALSDQDRTDVVVLISR
jgi:hypothetical protein